MRWNGSSKILLQVVNGDWEMMAAILELDAVSGVVCIRDFTVYVCDGDGYQFATILLDFVDACFYSNRA